MEGVGKCTDQMMVDTTLSRPCSFNIAFICWDLLTLIFDRLTSKPSHSCMGLCLAAR